MSYGADKRTWRSTIRRGRRQRAAPSTQGGLRASRAEFLTCHAGTLLALRHPDGSPTRQRIAAFHPTPDEPDLVPLLHVLHHDHGARLVFPVDGGRELEWAVWDGSPTSFRPSPGQGFGREPDGDHQGADALSRVDLVLAPALAVDRSGTRLGHGRGMYDRALQHLPTGVPVIAVVHPEEVLAAGSLPREDHDHPVDGVLTTQGLELFTRDGMDRPGPGRTSAHG
jgi:5-formyltetrahydrofolate cyclo-ligase